MTSQQTRSTLKSLISVVLQNKTVKQAFEASSWQVVTKILSVFATAWAIRCMGPENYGISGMVIATVIQLSMTGSILSDIYLIREYNTLTSETDRNRLVECAFTFRAMCALCCLVIVILCLLTFKAPSAWMFAILAAYPLLFFSINQPTWILTAKENVPMIARIQTLNSFIITLIYILFFRPGQSAGSDIAASAISGGIIFYIGWRATGQNFIFPFRLASLSSLYGHIYRGRWLCMTALLSYLYSNFELPLVGYLCSVKEAGFYRVASGLSSSVDSLLYIASLILFPKLLKWKAESNAQLNSKQKQIGVLISIPFAIVIPIVFVLSPLLIELLYGPIFLRAAYPFAILIASKGLVLVGLAFGFGLWADRKDNIMFFLQLFCALFSLASNLILIPFFGIFAAALVNLSSNALLTGITAYLAIRKSSFESKQFSEK